MSIIIRRNLACAAAFVLVAASVAAAQTQSGPPPVTPPASAGQRAGRAGQRNPAAAPVPQLNVAQAENQVTEYWNTLVLKRSQPALQLSDRQYPEFFRKMQVLQAIRNRHQMQRRRLIGQLGKLTMPTNNQATTDDATLLETTKALDDLEAQVAEQERQALAAIDAVLTPFQRARFRVFEENQEKDYLRMLAKVLK